MDHKTVVKDASFDFNEVPRTFLRKFLCIGLLSLLAILSVATYGIYRVYLWRLKQSVAEVAPGICQVVMVKEKQHLIFVDDSHRVRLELPSGEKSGFDRRLRHYLKAFAVDSMRIFDRNSRLVYGTQPTQGDGRGFDSPELTAALAGHTASRLEKNVMVAGFEGNLSGPADQVVSYVPVWGRNHRVLGAFEVRKSLDDYEAEIHRFVVFSGVLLAGVLLSLFGCVFLLVNNGMARLARAQEALRLLATTDPLTGVYNRREALAKADESFSRSRIKNGCESHFCCLMLDFDDFKAINDTYGHQAGDQVLLELTNRLKSTLRSYDIVGRFGGEEFLVVLPEITIVQSREIAERLRRAVDEEPFMVGDLSIRCSISIGGARAHPADTKFESVVKRADEGLYHAKKLGKNCTAWF